MDPLAQLSQRLEPGCLRGHQSQNDGLVLGYLPEGLEGSRTLVVVLEKEALRANTLKEALCQESVIALGQPTAALVAPSQVKAEGHLREAAHDGVVHLEPTA